MDQQQPYINNSLEKRDQLLMDHMNKTMAEQKEIAASAQKDSEKPGIFKRLFNKEDKQRLDHLKKLE